MSDAFAANSNVGSLYARLRLQRRSQPAAFTLDVDLEVPSGITILFGPSGAGKSTLLDCIAGLLRPGNSKITLAGKILQDSDLGIFVPPQARKIAFLFQSPSLFPHMTVERNAGFALQNLEAAKREAAVWELLKAFGVGHLSKRKPAEISGGEAQRVSLARALAPSPRAVLLDEPLKGLDADLRSSIVDDLRAWNRAHSVPILYVTHYRDEVDALGERVITLDYGKIVATGTAHTVLDAPRTKRLAHAAGFENHLVATVQELREVDGVMRAQLSGSNTELEIPLAYARMGDLVHIAIRGGDILLATQRPIGLSARNILAGTVVSIETRGATIVCRVQAGALFTVHLTPGALRSLEVAVGKQVWLVIKTHSCQLVDE